MATRARLSRAESKVRTREELVQAARQVFLERGYHGASLETVAAAAGFSTGAVYSAFQGKADLFLAVLDARIAERAQQMAQVGAAAATMADFAEQLARQFVATSKRERAWSLLVVEFWAHAARDPVLRRQFAARHDALKSAVAGVIDATLARTGQRLALPTAEVATAATALANGMTLERLTYPGVSYDDLFGAVARLLMDGLVDSAVDGSVDTPADRSGSS
jgi:AcrR family transcriptional regulator